MRQRPLKNSPKGNFLTSFHPFSYHNTSEPFLDKKEIPTIDFYQPKDSYDDPYLGDEYFESSMYSMGGHFDPNLNLSPKKSKILPNSTMSTSQKAPTTPSIMTAAGAGLSSLFSSLSHTLHSPAATSASSLASSSAVTSSTLFSSAYTPATYSYDIPTLSYGTTMTNLGLGSSFNTTYSIADSYNAIPSFTSSYSTSPKTAYTIVSSDSLTPGITSYTSAVSNYNPVSSYASLTDYSPITSFSSKPEINTTSKSLISNYGTPSIPVTTSSSSIFGPLSSLFSTAVTTAPATTSAPFSISSIYNTSSSLYTPNTTSYSMPTTSYEMTSSSYISTSTFNSSLSYNTASSYTPISSSIATLSYNTTSSYDTTSTLSPTASYKTMMNFSDTSSANPTSSYIPVSSYGIMGHSPILEEDAEIEAASDETYLDQSAYVPFTSSMDDYKRTSLTTSILDDYRRPSVTTNSLDDYRRTSVTMGFADDFRRNSITTSFPATIASDYMTSEPINTNNYMPNISDSYYAAPSYGVLSEDKIEEEYREDYEEGVVPIITSATDYSFLVTSTAPLTATVTSAPFVAPVDDYYYENSTYPMTSKLSTIPETAADIYLSNNDLHSEAEITEQLTTPGAYDYTENENDYIASGDLKNTNLCQANYTSQQPLYQTTTAPSANLASTQPPEQKKSRFGLGSLFSDGLNVLGSGVNTLKSTATNLAGGAVGVVGGVVAAAQSAQMSQHHSNQNNQNVQPVVVAKSTSSGMTATSNAPPTTGQSSSVKLTKQVSEMFDEQQLDDFNNSYNNKQVNIFLNQNI